MKKNLLILIAVVFISSCSDFGDLNEDPKAATEVPAETLFATATKAFSDQMVIQNVNSNIFRLFAQHWTETTYTDEANYDLTNRDIPGNFWNTLYRDVLKDLDESAKIIVELDDPSIATAIKVNQVASINILEVFAYQILVDTFADIPYTEALDSDNVLPAFDDDAAVYTAIIAKLDTAIGNITTSAGSFGSFDLLYGGNMEAWKKFANSLKLRLAVRIASVDASKATTMATQAIAGGVFTSNADNLNFQYLTAATNANPVWQALVLSGRSDYIAANTLVDIMNGLADPRRSGYFDDNLGAGVYTGGIYGANNAFSDFTHMGASLHKADNEGLLLDYAEVEFLLAEAIELGLTSGTAETHYNNAITASFAYWDIADVATYLAKVEVAYTTASSSWQETIATQKWLALFGSRGGHEGWTTYRQYGYPDMNLAPVSQEAVPRRYTYPGDAATLNGASYSAAVAAIGGDNKSSKVFWDN